MGNIEKNFAICSKISRAQIHAPVRTNNSVGTELLLLALQLITAQ